MDLGERLERTEEAIWHLEEAAEALKEIGQENMADAASDYAGQLRIIKEKDEAAYMTDYAMFMQEMRREWALERGV